METNESEFNYTGCVDVHTFMTHRQPGFVDVTTYTSVRVIFIALYSIIFGLGVIGNCCVIAAVGRYKKLQTVRNLFIVSLSASDTVVCCASLPYTAFSLIYKVWVFGEFMCYSIPLLQGMSVVISAYTLTAISLDRYILLVHPTKPAINKVIAGVMIAGIWGVAAAVSVPNAVYVTYEDGATYTPHKICGHLCTENWPMDNDSLLKKTYGILVFALQYAIPLILIAYCYAHIVIKLNSGLAAQRLSSARKRGEAVQMTERQIQVLTRQRRTNRMLIGMVVIFALAGTPMIVLNTLRDYGTMPEFLSTHVYLFSMAAHCLFMTTTFCNPILYGFMNESFRTAFLEMVPCLRLASRLNRVPTATKKRNMCSTAPGHDEETIALRNGCAVNGVAV